MKRLLIISVMLFVFWRAMLTAGNATWEFEKYRVLWTLIKRVDIPLTVGFPLLSFIFGSLIHWRRSTLDWCLALKDGWPFATTVHLWFSFGVFFVQGILEENIYGPMFILFYDTERIIIMSCVTALVCKMVNPEKNKPSIQKMRSKSQTER
jgi:hypothetical protein